MRRAGWLSYLLLVRLAIFDCNFFYYFGYLWGTGSGKYLGKLCYR